MSKTPKNSYKKYSNFFNSLVSFEIYVYENFFLKKHFMGHLWNLHEFLTEKRMFIFYCMPVENNAY